MAERAMRRPIVMPPGVGWRIAAPLARFVLRVDPGAALAHRARSQPVATTACRSSQLGVWSALWLGPDEQLLIGPDGAGPAFAADIANALQGVAHSLVDVSHRQGAIEVWGPGAAAMINAGCPLDLGRGAAPEGFCSRTVFGKSEIVLWRRADDRFQLEVWRSFLPYVANLLALAGAE